MRFIECDQGTETWYAARCGRITASCFADAVSTVGGLNEQQAAYVASVRAGTPIKEAAALAGYKAAPTSDLIRRALLGERTEDFSDTAKRYAADLAIERISGQPHGEPVKTWVLERGHTMEEIARRQYEARTGSFVTEAGICLTDDDVYGYSSDGLVDDDGLIEIKAPIDSIKILAMLTSGDTSEYDHQMQGGMWITGRKWCDFIQYVPDLAACGRDLFVKRIFRDDAFIDAMAGKLAEFNVLATYTEVAFRGLLPDSSQPGNPMISTIEQLNQLIAENHRRVDAEKREADHPIALAMNAEHDAGVAQAMEEIRLESGSAEPRSELEQAIFERDTAIEMLAHWCVAIDKNGTGWDDWDEHYKDASFRPSPIRELLDAAIAQAIAA